MFQVKIGKNNLASLNLFSNKLQFREVNQNFPVVKCRVKKILYYCVTADTTTKHVCGVDNSSNFCISCFPTIGQGPSKACVQLHGSSFPGNVQ